MIDRRVSREYAEALFDVAVAEGSADDLLADFDALESLLSVDDTLMRLLSSPMEVDEVKQRVVERT
ncbi:MAG TPA: F0F1 ATP synthase subunit delta, partial [Candidatus Fermentibacter daniensis]|nr:F0F1 ATP synthase subunit delta [Candidatus Fermentibacter daniensis]